MENLPGNCVSRSARVEPLLLLLLEGEGEEEEPSGGVVIMTEGEEAWKLEERQRLVAALGVFFGVVGDADHFGDGDGVEAAEGLEGEKRGY